MKWAVVIVRTLLGLPFVVFGLNGFLQFIALPTPPEPASTFIGVLITSKYLYVVKVLEILGGTMLISGKFVPLGLVILTPIIVNILLYEIFLMGQPGLAAVLLGFAVFLIWAHRRYFLPLFVADAKIGG